MNAKTPVALSLHGIQITLQSGAVGAIKFTTKILYQMEKFIDPSLLADNADRREDYNYFNQYTEDQLREFKDELAETSLSVNDLENEKKEIVAEINNRMKQPKESLKKLLVNIKQKGEFKQEQCFVMIDAEAREVGIYSPKGQLVHSRPCHPSELQKTIFQVGRTGS